MSDPTTPGTDPVDATPTEALQLADQQPVAPAPAAAPKAGRSHTRTILEVVGGVVAAGLIVLAAAAGFALGHATGSDRDHGDRFSMSQGDGRLGPQADGQGFGQPGPGFGQPGQPGQGQGMMPGFGQDPRQMPGFGPGQGIDPDGDNWTGQNRGFGDQDQGMMPGFGDDQGQLPGLGQDPRGIDPDGDNWTGQNQQAPGTAPVQPTPQG